MSITQSIRRRALAATLIALLACALAPVCALGASFTDVHENTPHAQDIQWLEQTGVSTGYQDGTFRPLADVYRQDMAAFLYRLAGEPAYTPSASDMKRFDDVTSATPHAKAIWWLASTGISTGYPDGTFRPMSVVVRQDMAAFLRRLATVMGDPEATAWKPAGAGSFIDVVDTTDHREDILWLDAVAVSKGYPDKTFRPLFTVVRQDMAAFLHRLNDHVASHEQERPTDAYEFGNADGFKYILITDGSGYEIFDRVWTTPDGMPINYFGEGLYIYSSSNTESTLKIPARLDGHDVKVVKFGTGVLPDRVTSIDATGAPNLSVFFDDSDNVRTIKLDGLSKLERVNVGSPQLASITLSNCTELFEILISYTALEHLDVSTVPNLLWLQVQDNELASLDISRNPKLELLACERNRIQDTTALEAWLAQDGHTGSVLPQKQDVTDPVEGTWMGCRIIKATASCGCELGQVIGYTDAGEEITYEDPGVYIASVPSHMTTLVVPEQIEGLPVIGVHLGEDPTAESPQLHTIDARAARHLQTLSTTQHRLSDVRVDGLAQLESLFVKKCPLKSIDLTGCRGLRNLFLDNTLVQSLDLTPCPELWTLGCTNSLLTQLDITSCDQLTNLACSGNYIQDTSALDNWLKRPNHSGYTKPQCTVHERARIEAHDGYTYVVVDDNSGISWGTIVARTKNGTSVYYRGNGAYIIEATDAKSITIPQNIDGHVVRGVVLGAAYGTITSVDAKQAKGIGHIDLACPNLEALHITGLGSLSTAGVRETKLSSLDLSGCSRLTSLIASHNRLGEIDLSKASNLSFLAIDHNRLKALDISGCPTLSHLSCEHNQIADVDTLQAWLAQDGHSGTCLPQDI